MRRLLGVSLSAGTSFASLVCIVCNTHSNSMEHSGSEMSAFGLGDRQQQWSSVSNVNQWKDTPALRTSLYVRKYVPGTWYSKVRTKRAAYVRFQSTGGWRVVALLACWFCLSCRGCRGRVYCSCVVFWILHLIPVRTRTYFERVDYTYKMRHK